MAKKVPRSLCKLVLTVHVVVSVGWIGIEAGLLALGLTGLYTRDPEVLRAVYVAAELFGGIFLVPVSIGALVTEILLSAGTPWSLVRHYRVLVKFFLTMALVAAASWSSIGDCKRRQLEPLRSRRALWRARMSVRCGSRSSSLLAWLCSC